MRGLIGVAAVVMVAFLLPSAAIAEDLYLPLVGGGTGIEQPGPGPGPGPGPAPEPPALGMGYAEGGPVGQYYAVAVEVQNVSGAWVCRAIIEATLIREDWSTFVIYGSVDVRLAPGDRAVVAAATTETGAHLLHISAVRSNWCKEQPYP